MSGLSLNVCEYCKKKLSPFSKTSDWKARKYHKTCNELKNAEYQIQLIMESVEDCKASSLICSSLS